MAISWMVLLVGHLLLKTKYEIGTRPLMFCFWYWLCMAVGGFFLSRYRPGKSLREIPELGVSALSLAVFSMASSIAYLATARRSVDSVDLYYFICESRDKVWRILPENPTAAYHFPGVYRFWGLVLNLFGESYEAVQWTAVSLLVINALLISIIVGRTTRLIPMALLSGVLYLVLSLRYEGLTGSREPLCTIPFLTGILCWLELGEHRRKFYSAAVFLGFGFGLALYCKQQAGLLSLGAIVFLIRGYKNEGSSVVRQAVSRLAVTAVAAVVVFLVLILFEGSGLAPLAKGLQWAAEYKHEGSWIANILTQIRNDESFMLITVFAGIGSLAALFESKHFDATYRHFCWLLLTAAAVTIVQYRVRGYLHYTLLAIPGIVIVFSIQFAALWRSLSGGRWWQVQSQIALILLLMVPMLYNGQRQVMLDVTDTNWKQHSSTVPVPWHEEPETVRKIDALKAVIPPQSEIEIVPSGRNSVYFLLSCINPGGYAFKEMTPETDFTRHPPEFVVVIPPETAWDEESWKLSGADRRLKEFAQRGYERLDTKSDFLLYQRPLSLGRHEHKQDL